MSEIVIIDTEDVILTTGNQNYQLDTSETLIELVVTGDSYSLEVTESPVSLSVSEVSNLVEVQTSTTVLETASVGPQGPSGATGSAGATGAKGDTGDTGPAGQGIPIAGNDGQVLQKLGSTNYVTQWADLSSLSATATQVHVYVKNGSGQALTKGQAVYINGASGANPLITLAQANTEATSSKTLGLLEQDLAINAFGYVATEGLLTSLNTNTATDGDPVWLSGTTAGALIYGIANKPSAPTHLVFIGYVLRANANNGVIYVKPQNGFELQELHNVAISSPATGQSIVYNSATSLWSNSDIDPAHVTGTAVVTADSRLTDARTPTVHASSHAAGGSDPVTISPSQQTYPLATAWASGTAYAVGDVVTYNAVYYIRRVAGTTATVPSSDTTNWAQRSPSLFANAPITPTTALAVSSAGVAGLTGLGIGTLVSPATGLSINNGSIAVSGTGGITSAGTISANGQSTTVSSLSLASGSLLATQTATSLEAVSPNLYYTASTNGGRAAINASQLLTLSANSTPTFTANTATAIFASTLSTNLSATYEIEGMIFFSAFGSTSRNLQMSWAGTAVIATGDFQVLYNLDNYSSTFAGAGTANTSNQHPSSRAWNSATTTTITGTGHTSDEFCISIKGMFKTGGTSGTISPRLTTNLLNATATIGKNSYLKITALGSSTVTKIGA